MADAAPGAAADGRGQPGHGVAALRSRAPEAVGRRRWRAEGGCSRDDHFVSENNREGYVSQWVALVVHLYMVTRNGRGEGVLLRALQQYGSGRAAPEPAEAARRVASAAHRGCSPC
jgi:hypothetical protein